MTPTTSTRIPLSTAIAAVVFGLASCGTGSTSSTGTASTTTTSTATTTTTTTTATTTTTTTAASTRPSAAVDELVVVSGARMHVRCVGHGDATVLLIAGFTNDHTAFSPVEEAMSTSSRVCSYDRFGTGTSDAPPTAQTFQSQARDLHELLGAVDEAGPYVVVGHSFGGDVAITFTSLFPSEVRGLLLLDTPPATWNSTVCAVADDGSTGAASFVQACAMQSAPGNNVEGISGPSAFAELATVTSLGDVPMIVDSATGRDWDAGGMSPATAAHLTDLWNAGQADWASLSSAATLVTVERSGHHIQNDRPDLVIEQVAELIA